MAINRLGTYWPGRTGSGTGTQPADRPAQLDTGGLEETLNRWTDRAEELIGRHPKLTVAAAVSLGIAIAWIVKRK